MKSTVLIKQNKMEKVFKKKKKQKEIEFQLWDKLNKYRKWL